MTIGVRLKKRREDLRLTLDDVAKVVGTSRQTIQKYESGVISNIPSDKIELLSDALGVSPAYIMGWEDDEAISFPYNIIPMPQMKKVPIIGEIACGEPIYAQEQYGEFADVESNIRCDFALLAKGDSMIDVGIKEGYLVFIQKQDTVNNGEIAAVVLDDEATLKRVRRFPGGLTMLEACNPAYEPILIGGRLETRTVRILGRAVAFQGYL